MLCSGPGLYIRCVYSMSQLIATTHPHVVIRMKDEFLLEVATYFTNKRGKVSNTLPNSNASLWTNFMTMSCAYAVKHC